MAKLMVIGKVAQVEILTDPEDEELLLARCVNHVDFYGNFRGLQCAACWQDRFDTTDDAINEAERHADTGRR